MESALFENCTYSANVAETRIRILRLYLLIFAVFVLFWWPLSHWFYPDWYHHLLGFKGYDYSMVKIIGTTGVVPVVGMFFAARDPIRNRYFIISLLVFCLLQAATYVFLITTHGFPAREYVNVALLVGGAAVLGVLFPWRAAQPGVQGDRACSSGRLFNPVDGLRR